ncbi:DUF883 family protein [Microbulbifer hydrolyticus]|uniref:DUF883 family protein n=1 Tax=Microbulbifer hydrolyticus TaxID=48074 RepID=A0A6P1T9S3_9GAMM|nr:DUF883 family protein [Microbulbifer hydrolyticus]MBB5212864.1 ElaB/YqjD/DUF883 family membrane-anchored ribosome-binding protein [Microbulbifer hydrolyticus]QHQ38346.1 DUF883 family protein [Microbulbifer hydrolyticus]
MATAKSPNSGTHSTREKLHQAYNLAGEAAHDTAEQVKTRARETAGQVKDRAHQSMEHGKQRAHDVAERAENSIKAHPLVSVGCAFAAGWLIAKILK